MEKTLRKSHYTGTKSTSITRSHSYILILRFAYCRRDAFVEGRSILAVFFLYKVRSSPPKIALHRSVDVGGRVDIRRAEHRYDRHNDRRDRMHRRPTFFRSFIAVLIVAWFVQDADAHFSISLNCARSNLSSGKHNVLFGCHIFDLNFITGGRSGYSCGNVSIALKRPPSLQRK